MGEHRRGGCDHGLGPEHRNGCAMQCCHPSWPGTMCSCFSTFFLVFMFLTRVFTVVPYGSQLGEVPVHA
jgi:hypothetical protein